MVLDIIIAAILVLPMAMGLRRGFVYTFIHTLGWIGALIAALFLTDPFAGVLRDSFVGNAVMETVSESIFGYAGSADALFEGLPEIMRGGLTTAATEASEILAELITNAGGLGHEFSDHTVRRSARLFRQL